MRTGTAEERAKRVVIKALYQAQNACSPVLPDCDERFQAMISRLSEKLEEGEDSLIKALDRAGRLITEAQFLLSLAFRRGKGGEHPFSPDAMRRVLDLERHSLTERLREQGKAWRSGAHHTLVDRFTQESAKPLEALLCSASAMHRNLEPELFDELLRSQARDFLVLRVIDSLREQRQEIEQVAQSLILEEAVSIAALLVMPYRLAGGEQDLPLELRSPRLEDWFDWLTPTFSPPDQGKGIFPDPAFSEGLGLVQLLPGKWARHQIRHRIKKDLPGMVRKAAEALPTLLLEYLEKCFTGLDAAISRRLSLTCQGIERVLRENVDVWGIQTTQGIEVLGRDLANLRKALLGNEPIPEADDPDEPSANGTSSRTEGPCCRICAETWSALYEFFCHFQWALTKDPVTQQDFQASSGLCPSHSWLLERISSPRGLCECYPTLLEDLAQRLGRMAGPHASEHLNDLLGSPSHCAACRVKDQVEQQAIAGVCQELATDEGADHPIDLCLWHLSAVLRDVSESVATILLRHHAQRLAGVAQAMRGYALKFDARRQDLLTQEELSSHREALELLAGSRNLFFIQTQERS
jgi:hypothetical protein